MKENSHKGLPMPEKGKSTKKSLKASTKNLDFYFSWHRKKSKAENTEKISILHHCSLSNRKKILQNPVSVVVLQDKKAKYFVTEISK